MRVMDNMEHFADVVESCMSAFMTAKSFRDPQLQASKEPLGSQLFASLTVILFECAVSKIRNVVTDEKLNIP